MRRPPRENRDFGAARTDENLNGRVRPHEKVFGLIRGEEVNIVGPNGLY